MYNYVQKLFCVEDNFNFLPEYINIKKFNYIETKVYPLYLIKHNVCFFTEY